MFIEQYLAIFSFLVASFAKIYICKRTKREREANLAVSLTINHREVEIFYSLANFPFKRVQSRERLYVTLMIII